MAAPNSSAAGVWALLGDALAFRCRRDRELAADPSTRLERLGELDRRLEHQIRREELVLFARIEQALPEAVPTAFRAAVVQAGGRDLTEQLGVCRGTRRRRPTGTLAPERM